MIALRILITVGVFLLSTFLFRKAAGTLKLTKLNMISTIYYYILAFSLIGGSLVFIGMREHYLIIKVKQESSFDLAYFCLAYCVIAFPLTLLVMKKIIGSFGRKGDTAYFIESSIDINSNMVRIQGFVLILICISTAATAYVFSRLGYIPVVSMFTGGNVSQLRQSGNRFFQGNQYIKNIFMTLLTPFVSYLCYIYCRITRTKAWTVMFIYTALLSVVVLTYDFSKSPIITYLLGLYIIEVAIGNISSNKWIRRLIIAGMGIILFFYVIMLGAGNQLFSVYTGPVGRVLFTQIATLFLHIEAFPAAHAFLNGSSFNSWMSYFIPAASGERSGRVVMEIYNAAGIKEGTAGVMNTIFIGEAYANFGIAGVLAAPVIFGIVIGFFAYFLPAVRKTPATLLLYAQLTLTFTMIVEGGFVDIIYSATVICYIAITVMICFATGTSDQDCKTALRKSRLIRLNRMTADAGKTSVRK